MYFPKTYNIRCFTLEEYGDLLFILAYRGDDEKTANQSLIKKKKIKDFVGIVSFPQLAVLLKSSCKKWTACDQLDLSSESCYSKIV